MVSDADSRKGSENLPSCLPQTPAHLSTLAGPPACPLSLPFSLASEMVSLVVRERLTPQYFGCNPRPGVQSPSQADHLHGPVFASRSAPRGHAAGLSLEVRSEELPGRPHRSSEGRSHSPAPILRATSSVPACSSGGSSHWARVPPGPA